MPTLKNAVIVHKNLSPKGVWPPRAGIPVVTMGWSRAGVPVDGVCIPWSPRSHWAPPSEAPRGVSTSPVTAVVCPPPRQHRALPLPLPWLTILCGPPTPHQSLSSPSTSWAWGSRVGCEYLSFQRNFRAHSQPQATAQALFEPGSTELGTLRCLVRLPLPNTSWDKELTPFLGTLHASGPRRVLTRACLYVCDMPTPPLNPMAFLCTLDLHTICSVLPGWGPFRSPLETSWNIPTLF